MIFHLEIVSSGRCVLETGTPTHARLCKLMPSILATFLKDASFASKLGGIRALEADFGLAIGG
jgi:hypothetical protein